MGQILLMRHGQTVSNERGCFLGNVNAPLTELGEQQSARAVDALVAWAPDRIITSPLDRCRRAIAEPAAARLGLEVRVDERIREFDFGPLEGVTFAQVAKLGLPMPWGETAVLWPPKGGGEPLPAFGERIACVAAQLETLPGKTACICHGGVIRGFFGAWLRLDAQGWNQLVVRNVHSFIFRTNNGELSAHGAISGNPPVMLESFGLPPEMVADAQA